MDTERLNICKIWDSVYKYKGIKVLIILWNGFSHSDLVFRPILTVTLVWNTGETGHIHVLTSLLLVCVAMVPQL